MSKTIKIILIFSSLATITVLTSCNNKSEESDAYGNFETEDYVLSSQAQGECLYFNAQEGMEVSNGDTIAKIDTTDIFLQINSIKKQKEAVKASFPSVTAQIEVQKEKLKTLKKDEKRIKNMLKLEAATQKQLDDIQGQINLTEKNIEQIKTQNKSIFAELDVLDANIKSLRNKIKKSFIIAPENATILETFIDKNELIMPGKPIVKLANLSEMKLKAWISGDQLSEIELGQDVKVKIDKDDGGYYVYTGRVSHISEEAEFTPTVIQTKEERVDMVYALEIIVKNDGKIKIGMPAEVKF